MRPPISLVSGYPLSADRLEDLPVDGEGLECRHDGYDPIGVFQWAKEREEGPHDPCLITLVDEFLSAAHKLGPEKAVAQLKTGAFSVLYCLSKLADNNDEELETDEILSDGR